MGNTVQNNIKEPRIESSLPSINGGTQHYLETFPNHLHKTDETDSIFTRSSSSSSHTHRLIDQIQFGSIPDKFCSVRILLMQSGMTGNITLYDTHNDEAFKQIRAKLHLNIKELNEKFRKERLLKRSTPSFLAKSAPSVKPLLVSMLGGEKSKSNRTIKQEQPTQKNDKQNVKQPVGLNDISILGEMLFGSIPIQIVGQNTKIHSVPQHKQTCLSKVFRVGLPVSSVISKKEQEQNLKEHHSMFSKIPEHTMSENNHSTQQHTDASPSSSSSSIRGRSGSIVHSPSNASNMPSNGAGGRVRSLSTSVAESATKEFIDSFDHDNKQQKAKKEKRKKVQKDQEVYMCKSSFGISVLLVFHDSGEDKDDLQNPNQLQRLIFSHFPLFEHRLRKLLNTCKQALQKYLKKIVEDAKEAGRLEEMFSGFTFNIRSFHGCLQESEEISKASIDFHRFIISFLHAPRFHSPIWQSHSLMPFKKGNDFSSFLNDLLLLTNEDPQNKGFMTQIISTILANHLSWIAHFTKSSETEETSPSHLLVKYLRSLYGAGYIGDDEGYEGDTSDSLSTSSCEPKKHRLGLKKFCKIIVVGSSNRQIRYCISLITYLLKSVLLLEKEFSVDKKLPGAVQNVNPSEPNMREPLVTLTPMQFLEMAPPLESKKSPKLFQKPFVGDFLPASGQSDDDNEASIKPVTLVPQPDCSVTPYTEEVEQLNLKNKFNKFGNALFGDVCTWYCGGFVISGLPRYVTFQQELIEDLEFVQTESIDGDTRLPDTASCVIVDIEGRSCNVIVSHQSRVKFEEGHASDMISNMLSEILCLKTLNDSPETNAVCEQLFQDTLYSLVLKAKLLLTLSDSLNIEQPSKNSIQAAPSLLSWRSQKKQNSKGLADVIKKKFNNNEKSKKQNPEPISYGQIAGLLGVSTSDMPLLISIASAYRADIVKKVVPQIKSTSKKKKR
ncbi:hypothetical protein C9374_001617 [Naegleria lovaniensis]|uniref:UDENN FNIP1/2-type domain-containing protein n=1 Tax=Naegleria lovaniensis TaxID=51637 RepID=A0AA88GUR9_NAELO|nr:uncharacterized protein C9374_001617 [Naegleria lovaniensis]KAG2387285.1 hypothetical protein C9374_001617 [Naegleria lovaniensis]